MLCRLDVAYERQGQLLQKPLLLPHTTAIPPVLRRPERFGAVEAVYRRPAIFTERSSTGCFELEFRGIQCSVEGPDIMLWPHRPRRFDRHQSCPETSAGDGLQRLHLLPFSQASKLFGVQTGHASFIDLFNLQLDQTRPCTLRDSCSGACRVSLSRALSRAF